MQGPKATLLLTTLLLTLALPLISQSPIRAQETSHTFPETGKTVRGIFLQYWTTHGGLAQQGYPISDEMMLRSTDGREYRTQFFQRAVFEHHPEFAGTPNEVLLKLVGQTFYERHFQTSPPPNQTVNPTNTITFKETGHSIGGKFREYWEQHGGLAQQGYPMTGEFKMASTDGKEYTTQVFQRAVFELHPEFAGTENEVLLRLLGVEEWEEVKRPAATITPNPMATAPSDGGSPTATVESAQNLVEIPTKYGSFKFPSSNFDVISEENMAKLFERIHDSVGLQDTQGFELELLDNNDLLANIGSSNGNYNGAKVRLFDVGHCQFALTEVLNGKMYMQFPNENKSNFKDNMIGCKDTYYDTTYEKPAGGYFSGWVIRDILATYGKIKFAEVNGKLGDLAYLIKPEQINGESVYAKLPVMVKPPIPEFE